MNLKDVFSRNLLNYVENKTKWVPYYSLHLVLSNFIQEEVAVD